MSLLAPLGLLGLLGVAVLVFIYLIKPNYQQKFVSSTYIWQRSLKYRKKRVPVSPLRNLLIFLCQLLALVSFGFLIALPVIPHLSQAPKNEKIAVIDASASMLVETDGVSRFERAVDEVLVLAESTLSEEGGALSVVVADAEAYILVSRAGADSLAEVKDKISSLVEGDAPKCGYGSADLTGAATLAEEILRQNSESEVLLYTATEYIDKTSFTVVDVSHEQDWNVAVLDCTPILLETNNYSFAVDVGCFGRSKSVSVTCELYGVNKKKDKNGVVTDPGKRLTATKTEYFSELSSSKTLTFSTEDFDGDGAPILSYEYMYVHVDEADGFEKDNSFNVYGGEKPVLRIQYASSTPNNFFSGILRTLRQAKKGSYDIEISEVSPSAAKTEGYDLYLFEHKMPDVMPKDGVVMLVDPDKAPEGSGLRLGELVSVNSSSTLASGAPHAVTKNVNPDRITVAEYRKITSSDGYEELLYYHGDPVMLLKDDGNKKAVVLALNLNKSSLGVVLDFPTLIYNIFEYFLPSTLTANDCEVGGSLTVNARGDESTLDGPGYAKVPLTGLPMTVQPTLPGDYTVTQINMRGEPEVEQFFVHIPREESDIEKRVDQLPLLHTETTEVESDIDLLFYIALFALVCLFAEWWLHSREKL